MKRNEMTVLDMLAESVGIVACLIYLVLQIFYGITYGVGVVSILMNVAMLLLVYIGLTILEFYPEKVNGLTKESCTGLVKKYTVRMVRIAKLIFVLSLLFTSICDVLGKGLNSGYSIIVVILIVATAAFYEYRIIKILRSKK